MRFEYTDPPRFEIVADGRSVAIVDKKLNTQDEYFIGQTPLKFLLSDHIDMARDTKVLNVAQEGKTVTIELEDRAALGGTAHLSLVFDASTFALKQWTVIDAQGFQTVVTLFNLDLTTQPDPGAVPHRREPAGQSAWQPQALTTDAVDKARHALALLARGRECGCARISGAADDVFHHHVEHQFGASAHRSCGQISPRAPARRSVSAGDEMP